MNIYIYMYNHVYIYIYIYIYIRGWLRRARKGGRGRGPTLMREEDRPSMTREEFD